MNTHPFEVVDAQVHLNGVGLEPGLVAMDAVGVDALVIDEFTGFDAEGRVQPGHPLPGGSYRHTAPFAEDAVARHPDRFCYLTRIEPDDPDIDELVAGLRDRPGLRALRLIPFIPVHPMELDRDPRNVQVSRAAAARFANDVRGERYARWLAAAERHDVPVFLQLNGTAIPGDFSLARDVAQRHPGLRLVIDHTGLELPGSWGVARPDRFAQVPELLALADLPNVFLKWGHAPLLSEEPYPFPDVREHLHRVVDAFGVERVMWASDWTVDILHNSWAESLGTILDDPVLTVEEKSWLLGRTVRTVLDWPSPRR